MGLLQLKGLDWAEVSLTGAAAKRNPPPPPATPRVEADGQQGTPGGAGGPRNLRQLGKSLPRQVFGRGGLRRRGTPQSHCSPPPRALSRDARRCPLGHGACRERLLERRAARAPVP